MINAISDLQVEGMVIVRGYTEHPSKNFKYRELVLEVNSNVDGKDTIEYLNMRFLHERVELLEEIRCGYRVLVTFKITGRKWKKSPEETKYFTNLEGINLEVLDDTHNFEKGTAIPGAGKQELEDFPNPEEYGDLPF